MAALHTDGFLVLLLALCYVKISTKHTQCSFYARFYFHREFSKKATLGLSVCVVVVDTSWIVREVYRTNRGMLKS